MLCKKHLNTQCASSKQLVGAKTAAGIIRPVEHNLYYSGKQYDAAKP